MKIISTESSYNFHDSLGLSECIYLECGIAFDALESDAKILLTYPGVIKADVEAKIESVNMGNKELLNTEVDTELPTTEL